MNLLFLIVFVAGIYLLCALASRHAEKLNDKVRARYKKGKYIGFNNYGTKE